uniref:NADH dehydrogenase subunit 6 n=1 Tax=Chicoreus torrefactus TaxID=693199 RepID=A0A345WJ20_9CAEN|nr:NADH dehydrogenase subunit 6 [Chicoreus torrefactus]AXJ93063.1 NADH dehydrogenase subunit 6 [Chicoreus torrefactus]QUL61402.1 NADH dehydrogenase subunit 6 [Chicoreus asianus]
MTTMIILAMALSSLFLLPLMFQPLSLGLVIMISTLLMCVVAAITLSSWYGFILFLIYVGGLLVMFAYVAALSPNVLFGSMKPALFYIFLLMILSLFFFGYFFIDSSSIGYLTDHNLMKHMKMYGMEMVSPHMASILIGLATILLINLVVVVKICYYTHASLRPFKE